MSKIFGHTRTGKKSSTGIIFNYTMNVYSSIACVHFITQIEQDFRCIFGDATSVKFLEKWPTVFKQKALKESRGLTQTSELQDLTINAESTSEVEEGMVSVFCMYVFFLCWMELSRKAKCRCFQDGIVICQRF